MAYVPLTADDRDDLDEGLVLTSSRAGLFRSLTAGALAGQFAGLAMAFVFVGLAHPLGKGPLFSFQALSETAIGQGALGSAPTWLYPALGFAIHLLGPALGWGLFFGLIVWMARTPSAGTLLVLGLLVGTLAYAVDTYVLLPRASAWLGHENAWRDVVPPACTLLGHAVYGFALSLLPWRYDPVLGRFA